jgi:hypothetical protein
LHGEQKARTFTRGWLAGDRWRRSCHDVDNTPRFQVLQWLINQTSRRAWRAPINHGLRVQADWFLEFFYTFTSCFKKKEIRPLHLLIYIRKAYCGLIQLHYSICFLRLKY